MVWQCLQTATNTEVCNGAHGLTATSPGKGSDGANNKRISVLCFFRLFIQTIPIWGQLSAILEMVKPWLYLFFFLQYRAKCRMGTFPALSGNSFCQYFIISPTLYSVFWPPLTLPFCPYFFRSLLQSLSGD